jgi:hypothetical protein
MPAFLSSVIKFRITSGELTDYRKELAVSIILLVLYVILSILDNFQRIMNG